MDCLASCRSINFDVYPWIYLQVIFHCRKIVNTLPGFLYHQTANTLIETRVIPTRASILRKPLLPELEAAPILPVAVEADPTREGLDSELTVPLVRNITPVVPVRGESLGTAKGFAVVCIAPGGLIPYPILASTNLAQQTNGEYNSIVKGVEEGLLRRACNWESDRTSPCKRCRNNIYTSLERCYRMMQRRCRHIVGRSLVRWLVRSRQGRPVQQEWSSCYGKCAKCRQKILLVGARVFI